jgi:hypothetical protein
LIEIGQGVFCLFEEISKKTVKTFTTFTMHKWERVFFEYFCLGITPDYSTNGGRVIDTLYLEEKGKK